MKAQALHNMNKVAGALLKTPGKPSDLDGTLKHIANTAHDAFATDACVVMAFNPITGKFIGSQTVGAHIQGENERLHKKPRLKGAAQQVLRDGMLFIEDVDAKPQYHNRFTRKTGMRAFAGVAMRTRHRQRPLGVIYLDFKQPRTFSPTERESFQTFAVQASFLLQETWLARHYEQVARIGQEVNHNLATVDVLFEVLQTYVDEVLDESHTLVLAVSQPQTNTLDVYLREYGETIHVSTLLRSVYQHVIQTRKPLFIEQLSEEAAHLPFQVINITGKEQKESLIFVPLMLRGLSLGVLSIQHALPKAYGQEDLFILQLLASYAALGLHNIRLYSSLSQLNDTGQLLTQQLKSEHTLQAIVDQIQEATKADLVVLYPYEPTLQCFDFPARIAGTLLDSTIQSMYPSRPDAIASLMLHRERPIFAKDSTLLYTELQGNGIIRQGTFPEREKICSAAAMPLRVGDESVGVLFVNFRQPQRFDATQKLFIEGLAHYAAIAIKNAQVFGTLSQRRLHEFEILQHIDRELSRSLELEPVLNTLLKLANKEVHAEEAAILLYDRHLQALEIQATLGTRAEERQARIVPLGEAKGITRWALAEKKPARVDDVHRDLPWRDLYIPASADTVSELDVPLLDGEEVVGVLNFESTREGAFRQEDEDFLVTLAGQAVLAIKNAQAYEREKRLVEEGKVLNEISKEIIGQLDPVRVFDLILEKALDLTHSTLGSLYLYEPDLNDLWMVRERGVAKDKKGTHQRRDQGIVGYVARNKELLNVQDVSQPPWNEIYLGLFPQTRSELAVPMLAGDKLRGVLNIESPTPNHFGESDEHLLQGLADLAVVALQNAEHYEDAKKEAQRFTLLYQAGRELGKITELTQLEQAYQVIFDLVEQHGKCQVIIRRYEVDTQELLLMSASRYQQHPPSLRMKLDQGLNGQVARERRTIVIYDTNHPPPRVTVKLADPTTQSLVIIPIIFEKHYYGNLELSHKEVGYFRGADILCFEGLAQQLASTIYRLEMAQTREELEQRALAAEEMSSIGQSAFEVTHRLDNDLGLVDYHVDQIQLELETQGAASKGISKSLESIRQAAQTVLSFSEGLREKLDEMRAAEEKAEEPVIIAPSVLLQEAQAIASLPPNIEIHLAIDDDVAAVRVIRSLVADILHNLVTNAIQAMPKGGIITLRSRSIGRSVALDVSDTGVGIPSEKHSEIFGLFFSTKRSSGFGLWSARRNALKNHGDLKVESEVGRGTTFTLILPSIEEGEGAL